jgi:hypothetical protein
MNFDPIDFSRYNKPPFLPQWLSRGETKKIANYGDKQYVEIDGVFREMSKQYDLDNIKGALLDRLGSLVDEQRDGKTDEIYRLMIRLRTLLNTTTGSIPELIKVIKFLYGSEVVHIVSDFPAGLIILHDGEGPDVNFNQIIRQVVGAGIDYSTKELFYFTEELPSSEKVSKMKSALSMMDSMAYIFHNGVYRRNGTIKRRYNGVKDILAITIECALQDQLFGRAMHNGLFRRNGLITHNGFVNDVATELWSFNGRMDYAENVQSSEQTAISLAYRMSEGIEQDFRRNGKFRRNGEVQHKTRYILDCINLKLGFHIQESHMGQAIHNGLYRRNGTIKHGLLNTSITEKNNIHVKHSLQDVVTAKEETSHVSVRQTISEGIQRGIRRNGLIRRDGAYNRAQNVVDVQKINVHVAPFTDTLGNCRDTFTIRYRKHYYHNGRFRRNGAVKHDANVPLPLDG